MSDIQDLESQKVDLSDIKVKHLSAGELLLFDNRRRKEPRLVTSNQLAQELSVSVHTVHKWRAQGKIHPKKLGRAVRYVVDEVVEALTRKGKRPYAK